jgi:hypothetical protein
MKRASLAIAILALAACHTPPPQLQLAFAGLPSQVCPSTDCAMVPMTCPTVMSIRIFDPADPSSQYLSQCVLVAPQHGNMCALAGVDLESTPIPVRDLEVQVALYPATEIPSDPMDPGTLHCPDNVVYSAATGFPVEQAQVPTPALGGYAFYHPGDQSVVVTLGCTDLGSISQSCAVSNKVRVTATVKDLSTGQPVTGGSQGVADRLLVLVGEPSMVVDQFVLNPGETRSLDRTGDQSSAVWEREVDVLFRKYVCLEVLEDDAQSTATVRCRNATASKSLDLSGVWLAKTQLAKILLALGLSGFPESGLTLGMVVDPNGNPVPGAVVSADMGTVEYLSEQGSSFGAGATASNGIFVSRDAMFGTEFSTEGAGESTGIGGLVTGRITVVLLVASASAS